MRSNHVRRLVAAGFFALIGPAGAVTLGQSNTFQDGTTNNWTSGAVNPVPPVNVASGGPAGAADRYLLLSSTGGAGAGSRLVAFAGPAWSGDYLSSGVSQIDMDLRNLGNTDLVLRLLFGGPANSSALSTDGVLLPAGGGWLHVSFSVLPGALTGLPLLALTDVTQLRLFHSSTAVSPGDAIAAQLGVDNVTAVPEPATVGLLGAGLAALLALPKLRTGRRHASAFPARPRQPVKPSNQEPKTMHAAPLTMRFSTLAFAVLGLAGPAWAQQDVLPPIVQGDIAIGLRALATGLSAPDYGISAPGDASRLFVIEQNGLLRVFQNGSLLAAPALDLQSRVSPPLVVTNANDERGFLGLAFHPGFNTVGNAGFGTLYTYTSELIGAGTAPTYAAPNGASQGYKNVVAEWKVNPLNASQIDPTSRRELVSFGKNANNHNGGTLAFGPDGYMYLALGDGGNARDVGPSHIEPTGNAQNLSTPLGKMLRFDPLNPAVTAGSTDAISANGQYRIPTSNPFQAAGQVPEIYAYGFRNPYRFSFDRPDLGGTGDLILADVGQGTVEEIDRVTLGGNYGWRIKEGDFLFDITTGLVGPRSPGAPLGLIDPIKGTLSTLEYDHGDGISITGGFVYRGTALPQLLGKYVFGDLALTRLGTGVRIDGRMFYADLATGEIKEFLLPQFAGGRLPDGLTVHGFGQDAGGELYAMVTNTASNGTGGIVYQITAAVPEPATWASLLLGGLMLMVHRRAVPRLTSL